MVAPNWIARAEYRYADYGKITTVDTRLAGATAQTVTYDLDMRTHTALSGLAYKFGGGPVVARYLTASPRAPAA